MISKSLRLALAACLWLPSLTTAAVLEVGPGKQFSRICQAIGEARAGDVVEVQPGIYNGDVCQIRTRNLTIRGMGSTRASVRAAGQNAGGKGIWVATSTVGTLTVENIEFSGAKVSDQNGAGIRADPNASLVIRNCHFHDNENGILVSSSPEATITIENSIFEDNGAGDGLSHNLYVNHVKQFVFRGNYSARSKRGHLLKSRATENHILYNRMTQETAIGSYEIEISNGGRTYIIGNVIQQGAASENNGMIGYRLEGGHEMNPSQELYVINNTFVTQGQQARFINTRSTFPAVLRNNIFTGGGTEINNENATKSNNFTGNPGYVNEESLNFTLRPGSPAVNAGADPGATTGGFTLKPTRQYQHPACADMRPIDSVIDIGAFENGAGSPASGQPARCGTPQAGAQAVVNGASFDSDLLAPGSIGAIFGSGLATTTAQASATPLPLQLGGVAVAVNSIPAPLYFVSPAQINFQVPVDAKAGAGAVLVTVNGSTLPPAQFRLGSAAPAIFLFPQSTRAIAQNQDYSLNASDNGAPPGSVIIVYMTGQGAVSNPVPSGEIGPTNPLAEALLPSSATIGGQTAAIQFLGLAPGLVGVLQANLVVPAALAAGAHKVVVTIDGAASNAADVFVAAAAAQ